VKYRSRSGGRALQLAVALAGLGCGDPERAEVHGDGLLHEAGAADPADDASTGPLELPLDAGLDELAPDAATDAPPAAYVPPSVAFPTEPPARPFLLSQVGLYVDLAHERLAPDLLSYEPRGALWSDGAEKGRYLRLPRGAQIDNTDDDHWQFPVGSVLFKEFRSEGKRLETRVIARTGAGPRDYFFGAFVWRDDESDAELRWDGATDVRQTAHDVPSAKQCGTCHNGEPGRVLGFSAVQTPSAASGRLRLPPAMPYQVPGNDAQAKTLLYLHANCGHCHNPQGSARPDTDLALRLSVTQHDLAQTSAYVSTVGVALQSFQGTPLTLRIAAGAPEQSGLYFRMQERGPRTQMPPIASERPDPAGLVLIEAFIAGLPSAGP
jgi:hypothetical protein